MKKKDYDDDLLVDLLARGQYGAKRIAREVGISAAMVFAIRAGKTRRELGARIAAAREAYLEEAAKRGRELARADPIGAHLPKRKCKGYDDALLVEMLASGVYNYSQIARAVGINKTLVGNIWRGENRPDLQPLLREARVTHSQRVRRKALKCVVAMVDEHIRRGMKGKDHTARKCREFIIKLAMEPEGLTAAELAAAPAAPTFCPHCGRRSDGILEQDVPDYV